jgi:hypothetical protein
MKKLRLLSAACAIASGFSTLSAHAASISVFSFQSTTTECFSEISTDCLDINANGLSGTFQIDLGMLDASGNGGIPWNDFINFDATNSVSSWGSANLRGGGILFNNWTVADLGIDAYPDFSNGWDRNVDGGGEALLIRGFGISSSVPAESGSASLPGQYCPSTGVWTDSLPGYVCPGGAVNVFTLGIQATYTAPVIQAVPIPAAIWLFGSGLLVLMRVRRGRAERFDCL